MTMHKPMMSDEELRTEVRLINQRLGLIVEDLTILKNDHENRIRVIENRIWITVGASGVLAVVVPIIVNSLHKS